MPTHLVNDPFDAVDQMLVGVGELGRDAVAVTRSGRGVYSLRSNPSRRIAVVVGGGSGHEPAFLGWVGPGFADAAAVGNVFASPAADAAIEVVQALAPREGALFLFGNYEGDVMNFRLAAEFLADEGIRTRTVVGTDDVASAPRGSESGRRGVAGGVVVAKVAGACADEGGGLDDVAVAATRANERTRSIGVALTSCHLPTSNAPTFTLGPDELDFGIGVHGEAGLSRRPRATADEVTDQLVDALLADLEPFGEERALVLANGFGATPLMEIAIVLARAATRLRKAGIHPIFAHAGGYLTSLQMAGVSLTVTVLDADLERWLAAPASPLLLPPLGGSR